MVEVGSLQAMACGLQEPTGPGNGLPGSYSWVGAGCCSWLTTIRQWIQHRTPDRCSSPAGGSGGVADASLSAHGLEATAVAPPQLLLLLPLSFLLPRQPLPASLVNSGVSGPLVSAFQTHQGGLGGEGEEGLQGADHDGRGHFSELEEEEEEEGGRLRLLGWGSRPAGRTGGCPSGVAQRCGCDWEDLQDLLTAPCCFSLLVKSCQSHCHCCCWCCGSVGHHCQDRGRPVPGPPQCCRPCPGRGQRQTEVVAENWVGIPGNLQCLGQEYTQSQTSLLQLNEPEETRVIKEAQITFSVKDNKYYKKIQQSIASMFCNIFES